MNTPTHLELYACNLLVYVDTLLQHHHSKDRLDLDKLAVEAKMTRIYLKDHKAPSKLDLLRLNRPYQNSHRCSDGKFCS